MGIRIAAVLLLRCGGMHFVSARDTQGCVLLKDALTLAQFWQCWPLQYPRIHRRFDQSALADIDSGNVGHSKHTLTKLILAMLAMTRPHPILAMLARHALTQPNTPSPGHALTRIDFGNVGQTRPHPTKHALTRTRPHPNRFWQCWPYRFWQCWPLVR